MLNNNALGLGIFTIIFSFIMICLGACLKIFIKSKSKQIYIIKVPLIICGLFGLIWFIVFRYYLDVTRLIDILNGSSNSHFDNPKSLYFSKVLLLDMCPFNYVLLMFVLMCDWKNKSYTIVGIWCVIGSTVTIMGQIWTENINNIFEYIFIKSDAGELYYFMHAYMLFLGLFIICIGNKLNLYNSLYAHLYGILYVCYVLIFVYSLNITRNATGLVEYDWINPNGEYHMAWIILGKISFPNIIFLAYFLIWISLILIICLKNLFSKPNLYNFWPKTFYKNKIFNLMSNKVYALKTNIISYFIKS